MSLDNRFPLVIDTYRSMVKSASSVWNFVTYDQVKNLDKFVVWRHDCDTSLNRAKYISQLDNELGIKSTFFINLHSSFYNIFELSQTKLIREIVGNGHRIGLHFDYGYLEKIGKTDEFREALIQEAQILEGISESLVGVFSFHNPSAKTAQYSEYEYGGLINCYSNWMRENLHYSSDSNGYWRHQPIPEVLQDETIERRQVLTHPEWWLAEMSTPRDRILRCVYGRARNTIMEYDRAFEGLTDRENAKSGDEVLSDLERALEIL
jgi:hypothetical protein